MKKAIWISIIVVLALSALMIILALPEAMQEPQHASAPAPAIEEAAPVVEAVVEELDTPDGYEIAHGELLDYTEYENDGVRGLTIKVKISSSWSAEMTVKQNYRNIEHLVKECGASDFNWIQYMASHDMTDGSVQKVISFTVPEFAIKGIAAGNIPTDEYEDYIEDLWLHEELR